MEKENRRNFILKLSAMTTAILVPFPIASCGSANSDRFGELLPQRSFGSTGEKVTMLGLGGWHMGFIPEKECEKVIEAAIESGIRLFDTAERYQDGISEERYGKYLIPKYRDQIFLFSKTAASDAATAEKHLEGSLRRLKTDYLDLWKMHMVASSDDIDNRLQNEVLEVMVKAKKEGKVKHIGVTCHRTHRAVSYILQEQDEFSTCMIPVNVADASYESFILNTIPELQKQKYGILAMKTLGGGGLLGASGETAAPQEDRPRIIPDQVSIEKALHFVWSLPVSSIITGVRNVSELTMNVESAKTFVQMNEEQRSQLIEKVSDLSSTGEMEWYKV